MSDWREQFRTTLDDLRRERDLLRVQLHLGKAEIKREWDKLEQKWGELRQEGERLSDATRDARGDLAKAAGRLASELKASYARLRERL